MGDRTTVTLTVLKEHTDQVKQIYTTVSGQPDWYDFWEDVSHDCFLFYEVNYGKLFDVDQLEAQGIAYKSRWETGSEYTAGTRFCRFTSAGEIVIKELYDQELNPHFKPLWEARQIADKRLSLEKLTALLDAHDKYVSVLPWDNQAEYGRLYRTRCLIDLTLKKSA